MNYSLLSPEALSTLNVLSSKNDSLHHSSNGDLEHHIVTTSMKTEQDSFVSCSQGSNPLGTMVSMTGVSNHHHAAAAVPGNIVTMATNPNSLAEQLLVAVQNMNGNSTIENNDEGKMNSDVGLASLTPAAAAAAVAPQLASVLGLAGLPQMAALASIPGLANLGVVGQLAAAAQVVQAAANNANGNGGNITLAGNAQQTLQQVPQLATAVHHATNTPQFILAGGQPIQGIQGAQLLIPTSSGVATQQIITIPVTQMMTNQMVQFVANNGQVLTTSLANLQALNQSLSMSAQNSASNTPAANGTTSSMQNSPVISSGNFPGLNNQVTTLPQILTNAAGQVIAITPQLVAHQMISNPAANNIPGSASSLNTLHLSQQQQQQQHHQQQQQQQQQAQQHHSHSQNIQSERQHSPIPNLNSSTITITQKNASLPITPVSSSPAHSLSPGSITSMSSTPIAPMPSVPISSLSSTSIPVSSLSSTSIPSLTSALSIQSTPAQAQITLSPAAAMVAAAAHLSSVQAKAQSSPQSASQQQHHHQQQQQQRIHHPVTGNSTVSALTQTIMTQSVSSTTPSSTLESTVALLNQSNTISNTEANIVDGINLEEIKEFAKVFKIRRLSLGLTQTQVGQALSATEGPSYSQSAICRFEKLDITPKSAQKIKPVLERWMKEAEERYKNGDQNLTDFIGSEPSKKRKRRTSFTPTALEILNQFFEKNTHPSGSEMTELAERLNYDREVVRVWFCNKRQALKNTIKRLKGGIV